MDESDDQPPNGTSFYLLEALKKAIWARRPILNGIMAKHGSQTLYRYSQDFMDVNKSPILDGRKGELIGMAEELIAKRLGARVAGEVADQLRRLAIVSTTDHHGPIDHPFFVNANIISAIPHYEYKDPAVRYLVVFSFSSVSVNNASAYPRGIEFHGGVNGSGNFIRLPILPDKLKMGVVYGTRAFNREDLTKAEQELSKKEKMGELAAGRGDKIRALLESNFGHEHVLSAVDLASQITEINFHLWPKLFHPIGAKKIPDLIYLEIETLVTELLLRHHLKNSDSLIYKFLFDEKCQPLIMKYFNNIGGAFSEEQGWGTYMFWAMDEKLHRIQLFHDGKNLVSKHQKQYFALSPEAIEQALREKKIFPGMLLCYVMISLYYGMKCLGGFSQVHDLTMVKEGWGKLLHDIGADSEAEAIEPVQTKELGGDGLVLAYLKTAKGELVPATGIDMALEDGDTSYENYMDLSKKVTLTEMMNPMLPEIYTVLYSSFQRDPKLLKLTPEQILRETKLLEKLE
ncbi:hypothetical protein HYV58_01475, partial [Candidatus Peregrinibacteria bacterium]|nr:hypothetical protein [Candidatus Peregrinibacteria bacterium]